MKRTHDCHLYCSDSDESGAVGKPFVETRAVKITFMSAFRITEVSKRRAWNKTDRMRDQSWKIWVNRSAHADFLRWARTAWNESPPHQKRPCNYNISVIIPRQAKVDSIQLWSSERTGTDPVYEQQQKPGVQYTPATAWAALCLISVVQDLWT